MLAPGHRANESRSQTTNTRASWRSPMLLQGLRSYARMAHYPETSYLLSARRSQALVLTTHGRHLLCTPAP